MEFYINRLQIVVNYDEGDPILDAIFDKRRLLELVNDYDFSSMHTRENLYTTRDVADAIDHYLDALKTCGYENDGLRYTYYGIELRRYDSDTGDVQVFYDFADRKHFTLDLTQCDFHRFDDGRVYLQMVDLVTGAIVNRVCKTYSSAKGRATKFEQDVLTKYVLIAGRSDVRFVRHRDYTYMDSKNDSRIWGIARKYA